MDQRLTNWEIYKKTLTFSLKRFVFNLVMLIIIIAYFILENHSIIISSI